MNTRSHRHPVYASCDFLSRSGVTMGDSVRPAFVFGGDQVLSRGVGPVPENGGWAAVFLAARPVVGDRRRVFPPALVATPRHPRGPVGA